MSTITADEYFEKIHRIVTFLDGENIRIVRTMKEHGPRNLQEISRRSGLPYPTVHSRVSRLEREGVLRTWIHPNYSKLGLACAMVMVTPQAGKDFHAREALKIPGYWLRVARCLGDCNGFYSLHAIPSTNKQEFEHYMNQLVANGLVHNFKLYWLGETYSPIPNFDYFNIGTKTWKLDWKGWLKLLTTHRKKPEAYNQLNPQDTFDKKDLVILKELVRNARTPLVDLAKLLSVTLPAAKYRFDSLVKRGFVYDNVINILPYAPEVSDLLEIRLDFRTEELLNNSRNLLVKLPFTLNYTPVIGLNSASLRIFLPRTETANFLSFLSILIKDEILSSYAYYLIEPQTIQAQTFAYKYYTDDKGWHFENREHLTALNALSSNKRMETESAIFESLSTASIQ